MANEAKKTRAQYLNNLAVAALTLTASAVLAGAPVWLLAGAAVISGALHWAAVKAVR